MYCNYHNDDHLSLELKFVFRITAGQREIIHHQQMKVTRVRNNNCASKDDGCLNCISYNNFTFIFVPINLNFN